MWTKAFEQSDTASFFEDISGVLLSRITDSHLREALVCASEEFYQGSVDSICDFVIDYESISCSNAISARQFLALYQKNPSFIKDSDALEAIAFQKFRLAEAQCRDTNERFRAPVPAVSPHLISPLFEAKRIMGRVLGRAPSIADLPLRFGPGSTVSVAKEEASVQAKLADTPSCSENLARSCRLPEFLRSIPHWLDCHQQSEYIDSEGYSVASLSLNIETSELIFVPKSASSLRSIIKQPTLNTMLQCGIGDVMAIRLKRFGIDLSDQTIQQKRAREGSLYNELATIDLSSASDTVSLGLVKFLLPSDWFELLSMARCQTYSYKNTVSKLEHFSSMGNGFTFPLESLIFWSLCKSICPSSCPTVYGDDIIIRSKDSNAVIQFLEICGFSVNQKKSHLYGPFRESCGADYLRGIDIRPVYIRDTLCEQVLYTLHNFFYSKHDDELCSTIIGHIKSKKLFGPSSYGDGHLHSKEWPSFRTRECRRAGYGGVFFKTYKLMGSTIPSIYPGDYVTPLYLCYRIGTPKGDVWYQESAPSLKFLKNGRYLLDLPCVSGYDEVSIYTFAVR